MARVLVTRPRPDADRTARLLEARGHDALVDPILEVRAVPGPPLDLSGVQAVACTSANGVRALVARTPERGLPLYAVGTRTAGEARAHGFPTIRDAAGSLEDLAKLLAKLADPAAGDILHASGEETAGDLAAMLAPFGLAVRRAVLYRAEPAEALGSATVEALRSSSLDAALLFSPRTARTFVSLVADAGLSGHLQRLDALCLSAPVAAAAGFGWRSVAVASHPDQESLLALLPE